MVHFNQDSATDIKVNNAIKSVFEHSTEGSLLFSLKVESVNNTIV